MQRARQFQLSPPSSNQTRRETIDDLLQITVNAEEGRRHSNANIGVKLEAIVIPGMSTAQKSSAFDVD